MPASSSAASSHSRSRRSSLLRDDTDNDGDTDGNGGVPVETLVEHLLAARKALGSMGQVLRANELATEARDLHAETVAASAQTAFLRDGMREQIAVLVRLRKGMSRAYDTGRRDFRSLIRALDAANGQLEHTMDILRATTVAAVFRPAGEEPRTLLDFVDESGVEALQDAIKASIAELQAAQQSFDGDLLRFDTDLRTLNKAMADAPSTPAPLPTDLDIPPEDGQEPAVPGVPHILTSLTKRSHTMAENLASLTQHFDLCVTAVRTTEGGAELAKWKAAQSREGGGGSRRSSAVDPDSGVPVSISGVIAEQEAAGGSGGGMHAHLEPSSAQDRAEMLQVVLQDAAEVDDVVADMAAELDEAEAEFAVIHAQAELAQQSLAGTCAAFRILDDIGARLRSYAAAETEFIERWENERAIVADRLADMDDLRTFYEGYLNAYETLILEAERRRTVEAKIQTVWRKARDAVERLVDADRTERESFRQEVGEFLPTDLWVDMARPPRGHNLFAAGASASAAAAAADGLTGGGGGGSVMAAASAAAAASTASKRIEASVGGAGSSSTMEDASSVGPGGSSTRTVLDRR